VADQSISERIVFAIRDRLAAISVAAGYNTDAGLRVELGLTFLDDDEEVVLSVLSGEEESELNGFPRVTHELQVHVDGHITHNGENSELRAQRLISDIKAAVLRQADRTLGGLCRSVDPFGRSIEYPGDGSGYVSVRVTFGVRYHDTYGAPWQAA
jgi:hypothetical protein